MPHVAERIVAKAVVEGEKKGGNEVKRAPTERQSQLPLSICWTCESRATSRMTDKSLEEASELANTGASSLATSARVERDRLMLIADPSNPEFSTRSAVRQDESTLYKLQSPTAYPLCMQRGGDWSSDNSFGRSHALGTVTDLQMPVEIWTESVAETNHTEHESVDALSREARAKTQ